jgi:hypothetical protein
MMSIAISGATHPVSNPYSREQEEPSLAGNVAATPTDDRNNETEKASPSGQQDRVSLSSDAQVIQELQARDREVRIHEAAHAAVGGGHAASPTYSYQTGPDGRSYAVGGEVQIDTSKVAGDPQATLQKAETIRAAALAPAQPSSADRAIAAKAAVMATEARAELASETEQQLTRQLAGQYPGSGRSGNARTGSLLDKVA